MIQKIEEFCAKFRSEPLTHGYDLHKAHIHIEKPRTNQGVSTEVSIKAGRVQLKGIRIKIAVRSPQNRVVTRPGSEVGPVGIIPTLTPCTIKIDCWSAKSAGRARYVSGELPPSGSFS